MTRTQLIMIAAGGSAKVLLVALAFQYIGGLAPCTLCIWQRWPHLVAVGIGALALLVRGSGSGGSGSGGARSSGSMPRVARSGGSISGGPSRAGAILAGPALPVLGALAVLASAGFGVFHVGVEQGWWVGLASCSAGSIAGISTADLLNPEVIVAAPVRCDAVAWAFAGLSMAGWNVVLSVGLAGVWLAAARK